MNLTEFEALRDLPGKSIEADIRFAQSQATSPVLFAENIKIENSEDRDLRLIMHYNFETASMTFNVYVPGVGPICRLDVRGTNHKDAGRTHKHSLRTERCPGRNLPEAVGKPELAAKSTRDLFSDFCSMASIEYKGNFEAPDL